MDGGVFAKWCNQIHVIDLRLKGTLSGGLPERPLKRDACFGISYQNSNETHRSKPKTASGPGRRRKSSASGSPRWSSRTALGSGPTAGTPPDELYRKANVNFRDGTYKY